MPTLGAVIPATLGAVVLTVVWTAALIVQLTDVTLQEQPLPADHQRKACGLGSVVFSVSYAPLLLWGPLLAAVTVAYVSRRLRARQHSRFPRSRDSANRQAPGARPR